MTPHSADLVAALLNFCRRRRGCGIRDDFLHARNALGETAYDLSLKCNDAKFKRIAWNLIQGGISLTFVDLIKHQKLIINRMTA